MDDTIIATSCLCDDLLHAMHHRDDPHQQMTDAEVMPTALGAVCYFRGNFESARLLLQTYGYSPQMLSKSRLNRRLHKIKDIFLLRFHV